VGDACAEACACCGEACDHVAELAKALHAAVASGEAANLVIAEDVVLAKRPDLWTRAQQQFTSEPGLVRDGGFGAGGGQLVRNGAGSVRRIFDVQAFRARLQQPQQESAA